jgi:hypothetical protein
MEPLQFRGGTSSRAQFSGFIGEASSISFGSAPVSYAFLVQPKPSKSGQGTSACFVFTGTTLAA